MKTKVLLLIALGFLLPTLCPAAGQLSVKAANKLQIPRSAQTIELSGKDLTAALGEKDLNKIHVKDASGKELITQAVDTDFDELHKPDLVIFQADFAPGETKIFKAGAGAKREYTKDDFKAYGRFVRERFDDFAWENDRIAHRTYGEGLETWKGEPLTSSTIDIWSKRTPKMVINDWYMADDYHADHGDGADFYSAGASRGCGGIGVWAADKLWVSKNFVQSRVLANGPIRVMFELVYPPFDVNGTKVVEVKRVTLDGGSQLDRFQSTFKREGSDPLVVGVGLKKVSGEQKEFNAEHGWLAKWEPMEKNAGQQGLAIVIDPRLIDRQTEDAKNLLVLAKVPSDAISYWAGFAWDKAGKITSMEAWKKYVDEFAQGAQSPIEVTVATE